MRVTRIIWLPEIEDKLVDTHNVLADEVEDILFGQVYVRFVAKGYRTGEDVYSAYGQTEAGRYLIVFFILKAERQALILSVRDMDSKERRLYGRFAQKR